MRREVLLLRRSALSLVPVTREEHYLSRMIGQSGDVFPPVTRREYYLAYMAGDDVPVPVPVTVDEMFLYALCGKSGLIPKPVTRLQMFMANSLGEEYELTPVTREEMYWNEYVGGAVYDTASGPIATFIAKESPVKQLSVSVEPVQSLNGYDNPWPAGGGKNKLKSKPINSSSGTTAGITWTINADGSISLSGTSTDYAHIYFVVNTKQVLASGSVNLVCSAEASYNPSIMGINFQNDIYVDDTYVGTIQRGNISRACSGTKIEVGTSRLRIAPNTEIPSGTVFYPAIEIGTTISPDWTPYSNICPITGRDSVNIWDKPTHDTTATPTATIQLGETVYGGTLDVVNGKMTVDRAMVTCTWGDFLYKSTIGSYVRGTYDLPNRAVYPATAKTPQISNVAPFLTNFMSDTLHFYCNNNQAICFLPVDTADSTEIQISYELATPFELTLTPEQISTVQGTNNVWSDAGDVTVEYRVR